MSTSKTELVSYVRKKKITFTLLGLFLIIGILLDLALPWFMMNITNAAVGQETERFMLFFWVGVMILIANVVFSYFDTYLKVYIASYVRNDLRSRTFNHFLKLPLNYFDKNHSGKLGSRLTNDVNLIGDLMGRTSMTLIKSPLIAVVAFVTLLFLNWQLALICGLIGPLTLFVGKVFGAHIRKVTNALQQRMETIVSFVQDTFTGIPVIRTYSLEEKMDREFKDSSDHIHELEMKNGKLQSFMQASSSFISILTFLVAFGIGSYFVIEERMEIGGLVAFIQLLNYIVWPFTGLAHVWGQFQESLAASDRIFESLGEQTALDHFKLQNKVKDFKEIEFVDVSFTYDETKVINHFNFKLEKGTNAAIVGANGSGKSTLLKLILNLYDYDGIIKIDGRNTKDMSFEELLSYFALVPQESFLFPGTIAGNIRLGKEHASMDEVISAAKVSNAMRFIQDLPSTFDYQVGERGNKLSGGQKQRIAIARAILKDSPVVLLDEPTSSLDRESEKVLVKTISDLMENKTTVVITHDLDIIKEADVIIVLQDGEIIETGTHRELIQNKSEYYHLLNSDINANVAI